MITAATLVACTLLQDYAGLTAEEEKAALGRGQKYLDKVAASWIGKLPQERLLGFYAGRFWVASLRIRIKALPAGGPAAYEIVHLQEGNIFGNEMKSEHRMQMDAHLAPVSGEYVSSHGGKTWKMVLATFGGKYKVVSDFPDIDPEREGPMGPGITIEARFLPLFLRPDEDGQRLLCLTGDKGLNDFKRLPGTVERTIDGKKQACQVLQIDHGGTPYDQWCFSEDGRPLELRIEIQPGGPTVRYRPIPESAIGKPLDEPLEIHPAVRPVLDSHLAIKKNDPKAFAACFDFDRWARESTPNYAALTPADQKKAADVIRDSLMKKMLTEPNRARLPEVSQLEAALAGALTMVEQDGVTKVLLNKRGACRIYQAKDGARKGQWLIYMIEE